MIEPVRPRWRKSRRSGTGDNCVEIAGLDGMRAVRDSKDPDGGVLAFDTAVWSSLIGRIKRGEFDIGGPDPSGYVASAECITAMIKEM
ncbi:DUF397 domain-containing protein [Actinomadura rugatobispora]|uniref:DUF397 domain-containing protein n=1 Tax=Actinomadura rugatobispora TaxID=1994 RepID=A0ABW1A9S4_9ACTN|nr:hypothetical protein GCM10010200_006120 [Actinomadura rugatobispora]